MGLIVGLLLSMLIGLSLGFLGGGGSLIIVPVLVYVLTAAYRLCPVRDRGGDVFGGEELPGALLSAAGGSVCRPGPRSIRLSSLAAAAPA